MPTKPEDLYEKYKEAMIDDFRQNRSKDVALTEELRHQLVMNDLLWFI